jgi:hypothetical protein
MEKQNLKGKCHLCGGIFSRSAMTRHLSGCKLKHVLEKPRGGLTGRTFHLVVADRYNRAYWLHLEVDAKKTLDSLDSFLRDIWLECCGHMSQFIINGKYYTSSAVDDFGFRSYSMNIPLGKVLTAGMKFVHEYDFGSTTELVIRVVSEGEFTGMFRSDEGDELQKAWGKEGIFLLARNEPPLINCEVCGEAATLVCAECIYDGEGWLCAKCAGNHECGEEMFLPVVNSPRLGVCAYTG